MKKEDLDYAEFKRRYKKRLQSELGDRPEDREKITTRDYEIFKKTFLPKNLTYYEQFCNFAEKLMPITPDKKEIPKIEDAIRIAHLNISPRATMSFAALTALLIVLAGLVLGLFIPSALGASPDSGFFFVFFSIILALILFLPLAKLPYIIANIWRMKASNQMVLSIFYIVTYMRHTPNLELAIDFAAEHLSPPLSLDFKKVIWDIETGKFDNVSESLDHYLQAWTEHNPEFIEAMHLIQGSLYEAAESRRQDALDKSLKVILDETYEKMLHFTHDLKSPMTTLHMLGIILPILGLVILPLATAFMAEARWYHIFALYNIALPIIVYYLGKDILSTRPTGYGGVDVSALPKELVESNKVTIKVKEAKGEGISFSPKVAAVLLFAALFFIGIIPLLIHSANPDTDYAILDNLEFVHALDIRPGDAVIMKMLDYRDLVVEDQVVGKIGPYGVGASLLSLALPLAFGLGFGFYNLWRSVNVAKIRDSTKKLELEFASALFQLGNRLADGVPAEIAFGSVSKVMHNTESGKFFDTVTANIVKLGMNVEDAIFDEQHGAIHDFPSSIIESSMKVFIESSRKGPITASQALITVAEYIKSMHRVDERLKDLMADIVSSMRSQINFLTPAIAGIVVGITSMISQILGSLNDKLAEFNSSNISTGLGAQSILDMFGAGGVPTYFFQAIVGLYVVQITYILTVLTVGIENGADKISERYEVGKNLVRSTLLYCAIAGAFILIFSIIAGRIVASVNTGV